MEHASRPDRAPIEHITDRPLRPPLISGHGVPESGIVYDPLDDIAGVLGPERNEAFTEAISYLSVPKEGHTSLIYRAHKTIFRLERARAEIRADITGGEVEYPITYEELKARVAWSGLSTIFGSYIDGRRNFGRNTEVQKTLSVSTAARHFLLLANFEELACNARTALDSNLADYLAPSSPDESRGMWRAQLDEKLQRVVQDMTLVELYSSLSGEREILAEAHQKMADTSRALLAIDGAPLSGKIMQALTTALRRRRAIAPELLLGAINVDPENKILGRSVLWMAANEARKTLGWPARPGGASERSRAALRQGVHGLYKFMQEPDIAAAVHGKFQAIMPELYDIFSETDGATETVGRLNWVVYPASEGSGESAAQEHMATIEEDESMEARLPWRRASKERLTILRELAARWDGPYSFELGEWAEQGVLDEHGELVPDIYVVLVLHQMNADGTVKYTHAISENPIAGPHAMYVFRGDVNPDVTWQQITNMEKRDARRNGARAVKHRAIEGEDMVTSMTKRALDLLTMPVGEFSKATFRNLRSLDIGHVALGPELDLRNLLD